MSISGSFAKSVHEMREDILRNEIKELEAKLSVAVEALEYIRTYKHPDYLSKSRGTLFEVAGEALFKIKAK